MEFVKSLEWQKFPTLEQCCFGKPNLTRPKPLGNPVEKMQLRQSMWGSRLINHTPRTPKYNSGELVFRDHVDQFVSIYLLFRSSSAPIY